MRAMIAGIALAAATLPATADTPIYRITSLADCISNFNSADRNGDGVLGPRELSDIRDILPTQLGNRVAVYRDEYIGACRQLIPKS